MKLLYDENLSSRLVEKLSELYPDSAHVRDVGLASSDDHEVWDFAAKNGFVIVSKDSDFHQQSFLYGHPPKVIWIRRGNCRTDEIGAILRSNSEHLVRFERDGETSFLILD